MSRCKTWSGYSGFKISVAVRHGHSKAMGLFMWEWLTAPISGFFVSRNIFGLSVDISIDQPPLNHFPHSRHPATMFFPVYAMCWIPVYSDSPYLTYLYTTASYVVEGSNPRLTQRLILSEADWLHFLIVLASPKTYLLIQHESNYLTRAHTHNYAFDIFYQFWVFLRGCNWQARNALGWWMVGNEAM